MFLLHIAVVHLFSLGMIFHEIIYHSVFSHAIENGPFFCFQFLFPAIMNKAAMVTKWKTVMLSEISQSVIEGQILHESTNMKCLK